MSQYIPNEKITPKGVMLMHLLDVIDKLDTEFMDEIGFYDNVEVMGFEDLRNTGALLASLKLAYTLLYDKE